MPPRRTPPRFRTQSPPLHRTPPGRSRLGGSERRRREPTPEEVEAAQAYARLILEGMRLFFAAAAQAAPRDPVRIAAIARARKIRALADRPGTPEEGAAARRALRRFLTTNDLELEDL